MKYLHLVWSNLKRKKVRTVLTLLSVFVAFVLFGVLQALKVAFGVGIDLTGLDRLIMLHKVSIIQPLPLAYQGRIAADPDVALVTHATWFGGIYQDPKNQFAQLPVIPEEYLAMYPEFELPEAQRAAWLANRTGVVVGRKTADKFGWQVGDRIPIQGTIFRPQDGSNWEFTLEGIYDAGDKSADTTQFLMHWDYVDEAIGRRGQVGWYIIRVTEPERSAEIAERIDAKFANSPAETKTATEKAFVQAFANQTGNIGKIVTGILSVVFFTLLLVAGNTMAQSVRERTNELGVLKTLGFRDRQVLGLVLGESMLVAVLGGLSGLLLVYFATRGGVGGTMFPTLYVSQSSLILGIVLVVLLGLVTGAVPAWQAMRLKIVDALARRA